MTFHAIALAAALAGQTADLSTTLAKLRPGVIVEANPFLPHAPLALSAAKIGYVSGELLIAHELRAHHHPKLSNTVLIVLAVAGTAAAAHNAQVHR